MTQFITMDRQAPRHSAQLGETAPGKPATVGQPSSARTLVSRRQLLFGAAGLGVAAAAVGIGVGVANSARPTTAVVTSASGVEHIEVPADAVTSLSDLQALESSEGKVQTVGNYDLPYGTLLWANDDVVAACLLPTESGSPLAQVGIMRLSDGSVTKLLEKAVGAAEHFEVYDARATADGLVWTEANVLEGTWRIFSASLEGGALVEPRLMEEGDEAYDTPTIAAVGDRAFWQVLPKAPNDDGLPSRVMSAAIGGEGAECVYECARRMCTPIYGGDGSVTIAPRVDDSSVFYQLVNIDAGSGSVVDQITLPGAITPLEAGYGRNGFMFSLADIYESDGGIANLGTYTPMGNPSGNEGYSAAKWFSFARTPSAAPAWCGDLLIVKSSYSVCGVDLAEGSYFAIDVENGADTYGEYLASTGSRDTFVTYSNIDHTPVDGKAVHACRVKVWSPAHE